LIYGCSFAHWPDDAGRVEDLLALPQRNPLDHSLLAEGIHSYLRIPLTADGQLIGMLDLGAAAPGAFASDDERTARQVADSLAVAIQNARLYPALSGSIRLYEEVCSSREQLQNLSRRLVDVYVDYFGRQYGFGVKMESTGTVWHARAGAGGGSQADRRERAGIRNNFVRGGVL
jgi:GAF domain-containing protein